MSIIRVKFSRGEQVKYISHLDLLKCFERAARRGSIPIFYSSGFNPHPHMVFGLPMSVGMTSEAEYGDFELSNDIELGEFIKRFSANLPEGLEILAAKENSTNENIMATIEGAKYEVLVATNEKLDILDIIKAVESLSNRDEFFVTKEGKKGTRQLDIKPMLYELELNKLVDFDENIEINSLKQCKNKMVIDYFENILKNEGLREFVNIENVFSISVFLSAGSKANLKPEFVVEALSLISEKKLEVIKVHRTELFVNQGGKLTTPI